MRLGAHMSISGGVEKAAVRAQEVGCETMQIFTKNSNQWKAKPLAPAEITAFRDTCAAAGITPVIAHSAYLINLAAPDDALYEKSIQAFLDELHRCELLGIPSLVVHPGAHMGTGEEVGLRRMAAAITRVHREAPHLQASIVLEVTAGQGTTLGHTFEQFAALLGQVEEPDRIGFCLDTCHLLAAGYDFRTRQGYDHMLETWDALIGIARIRVIHLNDSKKDLGSRVDRHEHIGQGAIGTGGFELLLNDRRLRELPMILETPKEDNADVRNLHMLRSLIHSSPSPSGRGLGEG
ncbi:MAG: deoxyribonuclease IV [Nitrospinae bacterium]|nr:deoxyribonuclease IV [Nitrospinota bacterium]